MVLNTVDGTHIITRSLIVTRIYFAGVVIENDDYELNIQYVWVFNEMEAAKFNTTDAWEIWDKLRNKYEGVQVRRI